MKPVEIEGKIVEVKKTQTIKEYVEVEEQIVKIKSLDGDFIALKGVVGFMDDIIVDEFDGKVKTKLDVRVTVKRIQQTLNESTKE